MSDMYDPYYDAHGCLVTPARPGVAYVPARIEHRPILGWNAGANSITQLNGDLHTVFSMPAGTAGVVVGLRSGRTRQTTPDLIDHGLYFQSAAGHDMVQVVERGAPKTALVARSAGDVFEIRRSAGWVTYWNGTTLLYTSTAKSAGAKVVNACLYASGDAVGDSGGAPPAAAFNLLGHGYAEQNVDGIVLTADLPDYTWNFPCNAGPVVKPSPAWDIRMYPAVDSEKLIALSLLYIADSGDQITVFGPDSWYGGSIYMEGAFRDYPSPPSPGRLYVTASRLTDSGDTALIGLMSISVDAVEPF